MSASAIRRAAIKETKARFSRLLRHPAWKPSGPIVVSAIHKFVTYLLSNTDIAVHWPKSSHHYWNSHAIYGITPATRQRWHSSLCPSRSYSTRFSDLGGMQGWVDLVGWLRTALVYIYTHPKTVTHPSTNRARRRLTSFMRRTTLTTTPLIPLTYSPRTHAGFAI